MHLAKVAATRPLGSHCADAEGERLEAELSQAELQALVIKKFDATLLPEDE